MDKGILSGRGLYFITDRGLSRKGVVEDVKSAIRAGVKIVQYREKELGKDKILEEAFVLRRLTKENGVLLIINDYVDIAKEVDADGVHLGQDDMSIGDARKVLNGSIIGISTHNFEQALAAEKEGADYIGVGPIFETTTKPGVEPVGVELIKKVKKAVKLPIIGIGGINLDNLRDVMSAGANCAAAMTAIIPKEDVFDECKQFIGVIR